MAILGCLQEIAKFHQLCQGQPHQRGDHQDWWIDGPGLLVALQFLISLVASRRCREELLKFPDSADQLWFTT